METLELALELRRAGYGDNGERLGFDLYPYTEDAVAAVRRSVLQWSFIDARCGADRRRRAPRGAVRRRTRSAPTRSSTPRSAPEPMALVDDLAALTADSGRDRLGQPRPDRRAAPARREIAGFVAGWLDAAGLEVELLRGRAGTTERRRRRPWDGWRALAAAERAHGHGRRGGHGRPFEPVVRRRTAARARRGRHEGLASRRSCSSARRCRRRVARRRDRRSGRRRGGRQRRHGGARAPHAGRRRDRDRADRGGGGGRAQGLRRVRGRDRGYAAHGSRPDLGVDAIAAMGPVLSGIAALDRAAPRRCGSPAARDRIDSCVRDRGRPGVLELPGCAAGSRASGARFPARASRQCAPSSIARRRHGRGRQPPIPS